MDDAVRATVTEEVEIRTDKVEAGDTLSTDEMIVEGVKSCTPLCDEQDTNYDNKSVTEENPKELADGIVVEVQNRWKGLKERLAEGIKDIEAECTSESEAGSSASTRVLCTKMNFMKDDLTRRKTISNTKKRKAASAHRLDYSSSTLSSSSTSSSNEDNQKCSRARSRNFKRRRTDPLLAQISLLNSSLCAYFNARTAAENSNDSDDSDPDVSELFAKFVAEQLRRLPFEEQREKKRRIIAVLMDEVDITEV